MDIKEKIKKLVNTLNYHSYRYYVLDSPEITDTEYDSLFKELENLEKKHPDFILEYSPTKKVGFKVLTEFNKITHKTPMLSLSNIFTEEELIDFDVRIKKLINTSDIEYVVEPKLDGLAISIIYENGFFKKAATRGDGTIGEDVTENIKTIKNVPLKLLSEKPPSYFEIRGEVVIPKKDFLILNEEKIKEGEKPFATPRNAAAGSVRQLDSKITATRPLFFYAHSIDTEFTKSHIEALEFVKKLGFKIHSKIIRTNKLEEVIKYFKNLLKERDSLDVEIDGVVIKVNDFNLQKKLGFIARSPRWAIAWKPPAHSAISKVKDIVIQIGRTGVLTPVAELEPITLGGVEIKRATLHNASELERKDIRVGDTVVIERAGDVIPAIVRVEKRGNSESFVFPKKCPDCETIVRRDGVNFICDNNNCPSRIIEKIKHFISRNGMNIEGLGEKLVEKLIKEKIIKSFSDIYKLNYETLIDLERMGTKSVNNILKAIEKSKKVNLHNFINSLGIDLIGIETAKELVKKFNTIKDLFYIKESDLEGTYGFGPNIIESLTNYFNNKENIEEINKLINLGLNIINTGRNKKAKIENLIFVITGSFDISREEMKIIIEENGGKVTNSISKNTDFLIFGENSGSKLDKAKLLNIKTITKEEFMEMLK